MRFIKAIEEGIRKANDAERIKKDLEAVLSDFNQAFKAFTATRESPFLMTDNGLTSNCPISIDLKYYSWPMVLKCGSNRLEVIGVEDFGLALGELASTAIFGDYIKSVMATD